MLTGLSSSYYLAWIIWLYLLTYLNNDQQKNLLKSANFEFKLLIRPLLSLAFRKSISTSSSAEADILNDFLHTGDGVNFKNFMKLNPDLGLDFCNF